VFDGRSTEMSRHLQAALSGIAASASTNADSAAAGLPSL
jgi:hypothetical protein